MNTLNKSNDINNEDLIIDCIDKVTKGIVKDINISNAYSSWKNTSKGLDFIKHDVKRCNKSNNKKSNVK